MSDVVKQPCGYCVSAYCDDDLSPNHDLSYMPVGEHYAGVRMMLRSGDRKPVAVVIDLFWGHEWQQVAYYIPRFCPNCGRELHENKKFLDKKG